MPNVLRVGKYRFFFFSKEGGEPPHIHVESGDDYAKFWLSQLSLAKSIGYNSKELGEIRIIVADNVEMMKEKWNEHLNRKIG